MCDIHIVKGAIQGLERGRPLVKMWAELHSFQENEISWAQKENTECSRMSQAYKAEGLEEWGVLVNSSSRQEE